MRWANKQFFLCQVNFYKWSLFVNAQFDPEVMLGKSEQGRSEWQGLCSHLTTQRAFEQDGRPHYLPQRQWSDALENICIAK